MKPDSVHLWMSMTKSVIGCLCAILAQKGVLDPAALVTSYVPELADSGYAGAKLRQVLDCWHAGNIVAVQIPNSKFLANSSLLLKFQIPIFKSSPMFGQLTLLDGCYGVKLLS